MTALYVLLAFNLAVNLVCGAVLITRFRVGTDNNKEGRL